MRSKALLSHDVVEVLSADLATIACSALQHFLQFLDVHGLSELLGHSADIIGVDRTGVVVVEEVENLVDAVLSYLRTTLDSLSPRREVMPSKNSQKSTSRPRDSRSAIMLKMVGFLLQKPRLCMADLSSRGSILPVASVSNRLKASLSSSISSQVRPGLSIFFLAAGFTPGFALVAINKSQQIFNSIGLQNTSAALLKHDINHSQITKDYHSSSLKKGEYLLPDRLIPLLLSDEQGLGLYWKEEGNLQLFLRVVLELQIMRKSRLPKPMLVRPQQMASSGLRRSQRYIRSSENKLVEQVVSCLYLQLFKVQGLWVSSSLSISYFACFGSHLSAVIPPIILPNQVFAIIMENNSCLLSFLAMFALRLSNIRLCLRQNQLMLKDDSEARQARWYFLTFLPIKRFNIVAQWMILLLMDLGKVRSVLILISSFKGNSICSEDLIIDRSGSQHFVLNVDFWRVTLQHRASFSGSTFFFSLPLYISSIQSVRFRIFSSIFLIYD